MKKITRITSRVIPLAMNDVDTDRIIPAQFLTKVSRDGYGEHVFAHLKQQDPNFVFNKPDYQGAEILLTRRNFGCGSSREHAVWALQQAGISVIIAESYSDIFFNNSAKNGLLLIVQPHEVIEKLFQNLPGQITVDLNQQTLVADESENYFFAYDSFRKECLLKGQDDMDYLLEAISA